MIGPQTTPDADGEPRRGTGRLAEEISGLIQALQEAAGSAEPAGPPGSDPGQERPGGHQGPECRVCPICQLIAVVRQLRPEAVDHLAVAVVELAAAVREALGTVAPPPDPPPPGPTAPPPAERIDVTD